MPALLAPLLIVLLQQPPRDAVPPRDRSAPAGNASVSGRVYSAATGSPVRGALVALAASPLPDPTSLRVRNDAARSSVSTDAAGRFRITGVVPGTYYVVAMPGIYSGRHMSSGYGTTRANDAGKAITVASGADVRGVDIALPASLAIEGRVVDENGEPLSRIPVFAARLMPGSDTVQRTSSVPTVTDDLGRYRLYGLEPGTYFVAADSHGLPPFVERFDGASYTGTMMPRETEPFTMTFHPSALSESAAQPVRVTTQDLTGIDIALLRARPLQVSGTVFDSQGAPAFTTVLLARLGRLNTIAGRRVQTLPDGRFELPGLDPGDYRLLVGSGLEQGLSAVNGRTEFAEVPLTVTTDLSDVVVVTQPGIGLAGQVVFAEGPPQRPPEMRIAFRRPDRSGSGSKEIVATMDDDLRFYGSDVFGPQLIRVTGLTKGWTVKAVTLGGTDITDEPTIFKREHDGQVHVVLSSRPSTLEGEVRGEGTAPPGEATVYVFSEDRASWRMSSPRTHFSDIGANGRFSISGLAAGRYYAIAIAREGFRMVPNAGDAFFDLLSKEATPFVIGDDERRTLELRLWRWPE